MRTTAPIVLATLVATASAAHHGASGSPAVAASDAAVPALRLDEQVAASVTAADQAIWEADAGIETVYRRGGDWTTVTCPAGKYLLGGGCQTAMNAPHVFQKNSPKSNTAWECGGHSMEKMVWAVCSTIVTTVELHDSGKDWADYGCSNNRQLIGGGCFSAGSAFRLQASMPWGQADRWNCGGHGSAKTVAVICADRDDIKMDVATKHNTADWDNIMCPSDYRLLGGGCNAGNAPHVMQASKPTGNGDAHHPCTGSSCNGWMCGGHGGSKSAYAMCGKRPDYGKWAARKAAVVAAAQAQVAAAQAQAAAVAKAAADAKAAETATELAAKAAETATEVANKAAEKTKELGDKAVAAAEAAVKKAKEAAEKAAAEAAAAAAAALAKANCKKGSFYTAPTTCTPCPAGTYTNNDSATRCKPHREPCAAGSYVFSAGTSKSNLVCDGCTAGTYSDAPNANACAAWRKCAESGTGADSNSPNGLATSDRSCAPCDAGQTFSLQHSAAGFVCAPVMVCVADEWEFVVATAVRDRVCATHSTTCPDNQWTSSAPVTANHDQGVSGRDRLCEAVKVCVQGEFEAVPATASSDATCEACASGFFKATVGSKSCEAWRKCPPGSGLLAEGGESADRTCTPCEQGTFSGANDGKHCAPVSDPCPAGQYMDQAATPTTDRTCASCLDGTFKSAAGNEQCEPWQTCGSGLGFTGAGTATKDRECSACELGVTFSAVDSDAACGPVRQPCEAGTFVKAVASLSTDLVCWACNDGTFTLAASQFACDSWRTCPAGEGKTVEGTASTDRECEACASVAADQHPYQAGGSFSLAAGADACSDVTLCTTNEYMTQGPTVLSDRVCAPHTPGCPSGQYTLVGVTPTSDRTCADHPLDAVAEGKAVANSNPEQRHATENANHLLTLDQFDSEQDHADVKNAEKEDLPYLVHNAVKGADGKFGRCQGDCDSDADCASGHACHQRTLSQPVPGCEGIPVSDYEGMEFQAVDYCVRDHDLEGIKVGKNIADVGKLGDNEPFKSRSSTGGGIGIVETRVSFAPEKPAYWYRGYDGVERGCTPGMHRALHTSCRAVDHTFIDERTGAKSVRKLIKVHHNPWARHYVDSHQHKCLLDDVLNQCVCCDSFILHTGAPTPAPNAVDEAVAAGLSVAAAQTLQCRFPAWSPMAPGALVSASKWGGNTEDITFHSSDSAACSTGHDSDAAVYLKQKVSGAFEFSFTYDDAAGAQGGLNRFMAGLWIASDPSEFQSTYPENNADGVRYFFSTETNSVYYATSPGRDLERKFASSIFLKGARMTLSRHANCKIVLYQNDKVWHTFKTANCNDGYVWLGHYADVKDASHYDSSVDADISCVSGISLCKKPTVAVPKPVAGPRCKVVRNKGLPKTGAQLEWAGQVQSWDATRSAACAGANAGAMHLKNHVWGNFEFGFTYDDLSHSTDKISRLFAGFWQVHDKDVSGFDESNPMQTNVFGPRYVYSPVKNELLFANRVEHQFPAGDYKGYKGEMSLVPGYKKPRARMMLVRYNGHVSLFKNGWRMYEWSEEDHKDGFIWLGHFADSMGQFCVNDVYLCN